MLLIYAKNNEPSYLFWIEDALLLNPIIIGETSDY